MPKVRSTDDPRPARLTSEILEAMKTVFRSSYPSGDQSPELQLHLDELREKIKGEGLAVSGDHVILALKELTRNGLIKGRPGGLGIWYVDWVSPKI